MFSERTLIGHCAVPFPLFYAGLFELEVIGAENSLTTRSGGRLFCYHVSCRTNVNLREGERERVRERERWVGGGGVERWGLKGEEKWSVLLELRTPPLLHLFPDCPPPPFVFCLSSFFSFLFVFFQVCTWSRDQSSACPGHCGQQWCDQTCVQSFTSVVRLVEADTGSEEELKDEFHLHFYLHHVNPHICLEILDYYNCFFGDSYFQIAAEIQKSWNMTLTVYSTHNICWCCT